MAFGMSPFPLRFGVRQGGAGHILSQFDFMLNATASAVIFDGGVIDPGGRLRVPAELLANSTMPAHWAGVAEANGAGSVWAQTIANEVPIWGARRERNLITAANLASPTTSGLGDYSYAGGVSTVTFSGSQYANIVFATASVGENGRAALRAQIRLVSGSPTNFCLVLRLTSNIKTKKITLSEEWQDFAYITNLDGDESDAEFGVQDRAGESFVVEIRTPTASSRPQLSTIPPELIDPAAAVGSSIGAGGIITAPSIAYFPRVSQSSVSNDIATDQAGPFIRGFGPYALLRRDIGIFWPPQRTELFVNPFAPATQDITVVSSSVYSVRVWGPGYVTLSGAATQEVSEGQSYIFTAGSTTLSVAVTGPLIAVSVQIGSGILSPGTTSAAGKLFTDDDAAWPASGLVFARWRFPHYALATSPRVLNAADNYTPMSSFQGSGRLYAFDSSNSLLSSDQDDYRSRWMETVTDWRTGGQKAMWLNGESEGSAAYAGGWSNKTIYLLSNTATSVGFTEAPLQIAAITEEDLSDKGTITAEKAERIVYVDSEDGSDSNSGAASDSPWQTLSMVPASGTGKLRVKLAYGSFWREEVVFTGYSEVTVEAYGDSSLPLPTITCADVATGWTETEPESGVYVLAWEHDMAVPAYVLVYRDDEPVTAVASLGELADGTYYTTNETASGQLVYYQPGGSIDPNDGLTELTRRERAVHFLSTAAPPYLSVLGHVDGICCEKFGHKDGLFIPRGGSATNVLIRHGHIHHMLAEAETTLDKIVMDAPINVNLRGLSGSNPFVNYEQALERDLKGATITDMYVNSEFACSGFYFHTSSISVDKDYWMRFIEVDGLYMRNAFMTSSPRVGSNILIEADGAIITTAIRSIDESILDNVVLLGVRTALHNASPGSFAVDEPAHMLTVTDLRAYCVGPLSASILRGDKIDLQDSTIYGESISSQLRDAGATDHTLINNIISGVGFMSIDDDTNTWDDSDYNVFWNTPETSVSNPEFEYIYDEDFDDSTDLANWSRGINSVDGVLSASGGNLVHTRGASDPSTYSFYVRAISVTAEQECIVEIGEIGGTSSAPGVTVGEASNGTNATYTSAGRVSVTPAGSYIYIALRADGAAGNTATVSSLKLRDKTGDIIWEYNGTEYLNLTAWQGAAPSLDANSAQADPLLGDPADNDWSLGEGTPASTGGRTAGSRSTLTRPDWATLKAGWDQRYLMLDGHVPPE